MKVAIYVTVEDDELDKNPLNQDKIINNIIESVEKTLEDAHGYNEMSIDVQAEQYEP